LHQINAVAADGTSRQNYHSLYVFLVLTLDKLNTKTIDKVPNNTANNAADR
jgi:hypothetical protein